MRVIKPPALFELRAQEMAECRGLAPHARRHALVSTEARLACPVGIPEMVRVLLLAKRQRGGGSLLPPGFLRGLGLVVFLEEESFREHEHTTKPLGQETVIAPVRDVSTFHVSFLLNGPRGRTCTCNLPGLSGTPLHWATRGACARPPVPTVGFAPTLCAF